VNFLQRKYYIKSVEIEFSCTTTFKSDLFVFPQAGKKPSNPAFWWTNGNGEEVRWSFEELGSLSRKFANILTEACGLQRGDRVILLLPRIPEWWLANIACLRTG